MTQKNRSVVLMLLVAMTWMIPSSSWARRSGDRHRHYKKPTHTQRHVQHRTQHTRQHYVKSSRYQHRYRSKPERTYYVKRHPGYVHRHYNRHYHGSYTRPCFEVTHAPHAHWHVGVSNRGWGFAVYVD